MPEGKAFDGLKYRSADGRLDLFARIYPASGAGKTKPPLLMMHGLTRNSADFEPLIEALGTERMVIVPDQRGRGLSQYDPDPANYRPDVYVADMWALMSELKTDRVICIGTSMGGLMAMLMGLERSERIAAIVLNDIGPEVSAEGLSRIREYVGSDSVMANWEAAARRCAQINVSAFDGFTEADWEAFAKRTCHERADGSVAFAYDPAISHRMSEQDPSAAPPDLWPMWDGLSGIPCLIIRGAKSDILTAATADQMAKRHGSRCNQIEIDGRGHAPLLDERAALIAIQQFLEG